MDVFPGASVMVMLMRTVTPMTTAARPRQMERAEGSESRPAHEVAATQDTASEDGSSTITGRTWAQFCLS